MAPPLGEIDGNNLRSYVEQEMGSKDMK